jgi:hypothetical protein
MVSGRKGGDTPTLWVLAVLRMDPSLIVPSAGISHRVLAYDLVDSHSYTADFVLFLPMQLTILLCYLIPIG